MHMNPCMYTCWFLFNSACPWWRVDIDEPFLVHVMRALGTPCFLCNIVVRPSSPSKRKPFCTTAVEEMPGSVDVSLSSSREGLSSRACMEEETMLPTSSSRGTALNSHQNLVIRHCTYTVSLLHVQTTLNSTILYSHSRVYFRDVRKYVRGFLPTLVVGGWIQMFTTMVDTETYSKPPTVDS